MINMHNKDSEKKVLGTIETIIVVYTKACDLPSLYHISLLLVRDIRRMGGGWLRNAF